MIARLRSWLARTARRGSTSEAWAAEYVQGIVTDPRNRALPDGWRGAVREWLETPVPRGYEIDEVDEMKGQLAYWDHMVAEVALPLNRGRQLEPGSVDIAAGLRAYRAAAGRMLPEYSGEARGRLEEYDRYSLLLEESVSALIEESREAERDRPDE